jgi:DNA-binding MarR family transcriptional regulator
MIEMAGKTAYMPFIRQLCDYLNETTGHIPEVIALEEKQIKHLPFFLRDLYDLNIATMINHRFVIATQHGRMDVKPSQIITHAELIKKALNLDVAFAFQILPAHIRQRLVQKGVAFIVPGTHMFLPFLMMDFRTRTRKTTIEQVDNPGPLSMPAQVIVLYHIERGSLNARTLGELSKQFNYSAMTLSRVHTELTQRGLCQTLRDGVRKRLQFTKTGRDLWQLAFPCLQSPVLDRKTARIDKKEVARFPYAGISAISDYTDLSDNDSPTVALTSSDWRKAIESGGIFELPGQDESGIQVELWGYDPMLLIEKDVPSVDRLSLYLSCKETLDERIQKALESLLEEVSWLKE